MRSIFKTRHLLIALIVVALNLSACVQPYSDKAFYRTGNSTGNAASDTNESAQSLSAEDIHNMLKTPNLTQRALERQLQKMNRHWIAKGFDAKTGEVFFINFDSNDNKEALVWHSHENTADYITMNTNHYRSIVSNLKSSGYKIISQNRDGSDTYSNGKNNVSISPANLYNNNKGYKIVFGSGN